MFSQSRRKYGIHKVRKAKLLPWPKQLDVGAPEHGGFNVGEMAVVEERHLAGLPITSLEFVLYQRWLMWLNQHKRARGKSNSITKQEKEMGLL